MAHQYSGSREVVLVEARDFGRDRVATEREEERPEVVDFDPFRRAARHQAGECNPALEGASGIIEDTGVSPTEMAQSVEIGQLGHLPGGLDGLLEQWLSMGAGDAGPEAQEGEGLQEEEQGEEEAVEPDVGDPYGEMDAAGADAEDMPAMCALAESDASPEVASTVVALGQAGLGDKMEKIGQAKEAGLHDPPPGAIEAIGQLEAQGLNPQQIHAKMAQGGGKSAPGPSLMKQGWDKAKQLGKTGWNKASNWFKGLHGSGGWRMDLFTDLAPVASNIKDATIAITGVNPVTGKQVGTLGRIFAGICAVPVYGNGAKLLGKAGKGLFKGGKWAFKKLGGPKLVQKGVDLVKGLKGPLKSGLKKLKAGGGELLAKAGKKLKGLKKSASKQWGKAKNFFGGVKAKLGDKMGALGDKFAKKFPGFMKNVVKPGQAKLGQWGKGLKDKWGAAKQKFSGAKNAVSDVVGGLGQKWGKLKGWAGKQAGALKDGVGGWIGKQAAGLKDKAGGLAQKLGDSKLGQWGKQLSNSKFGKWFKKETVENAQDVPISRGIDWAESQGKDQPEAAERAPAKPAPKGPSTFDNVSDFASEKLSQGRGLANKAAGVVGEKFQAAKGWCGRTFGRKGDK